MAKNLECGTWDQIKQATGIRCNQCPFVLVCVKNLPPENCLAVDQIKIADKESQSRSWDKSDKPIAF